MKLKEFWFFNGEYDIIFNLLQMNRKTNTVEVATTVEGKITVSKYQLYKDKSGLFFDYGGPYIQKIYIKDFEEV